MDKVKNHFKKHKNKYLTGIGAVACVGVGYGLRPENSQVSISNPALINYRPSSNTVQVQMTRPGPKSFVVQCLEDGRVWPSIRSAARDLDISPSVISGHLKGKLPDAGGYHFDKLDEI